MATNNGVQSNRCKQSLYFPKPMLEKMKAEAHRQDRSLSWIVQRAWIIAEEQVQAFETHKKHGATITGEVASPATPTVLDKVQP